MTPTEAAHVLGLSADAVRSLSDAGRLPTLRTVGGRRLFRRRDVEELAAARAKESRERRTDGARGEDKKPARRTKKPLKRS